ncbi:MAG: RNA polymerase sigma-70 factor (ECF subfamily) [Marinoscillum sp.]|jgi:RNA polymerase sigma-70 factor (ECF subfamily)
MSSNQLINLQDEKLFENLFKEHYNSLVHFAKKYVNDDDDAEEVVHQLFTRLWVNNQSININSSIQSYLFGAMRNACMNYLKHVKVKNAYGDHVRLTHSSSVQIDFLELDELNSTIRNALDKIPEKCREVFELSRYEGEKYQEIADTLNVSIKTVEKQMSKALKILRDELSEYLIILILLIGDGGKF